MIRLKVSNEDRDIRLDRWFKRNYPKSQFILIAKASRTGSLKMDGKKSDVSDRTKEGQEISFPKDIVTNNKSSSGGYRGGSSDRGPRPERSEGGYRSGPRSEGSGGYRGGSSDRGNRGGRDSRFSNRRDDSRGRSRENHGEYSLNDEKAKALAEKLIASLLYKDDEFMIINKPSGLATQGGTGIKISVDDVLDHMKFDYERRPRLVHRLDKETSGVLVIARKVDSAAQISELFRSKENISKKYLAIWCGVPTQTEGTIDIALNKDETFYAKGKMREDELDGKPAVTHYKVLSHNDSFSLVEITIVTGRMHQIRAHSAMIGCPILGDYRYSKAPDTSYNPDSGNYKISSTSADTVDHTSVSDDAVVNDIDTSKTDSNRAKTDSDNSEFVAETCSNSDKSTVQDSKPSDIKESSDASAPINNYSRSHRESRFMHLHAHSIEFIIEGKKFSAIAPLPEYFENTIIKYQLNKSE